MGVEYVRTGGVVIAKQYLEYALYLSQKQDGQAARAAATADSPEAFGATGGFNLNNASGYNAGTTGVDLKIYNELAVIAYTSGEYATAVRLLERANAEATCRPNLTLAGGSSEAIS